MPLPGLESEAETDDEVDRLFRGPHWSGPCRRLQEDDAGTGHRREGLRAEGALPRRLRRRRVARAGGGDRLG